LEGRDVNDDDNNNVNNCDGADDAVHADDRNDVKCFGDIMCSCA
jgi:hypothetical protein